jgi:hypothetical protein
MTSNIASITVPVPSSADGSYTRPPGLHDTMGEKARQTLHAKVDHNGNPVLTRAETGTVDVTGTTPGQPPTMVNALLAAATACGADPQALVDSERFMVSIGAISPADGAGLRGAVLDALAANPSIAIAPAAPGMQPNRAQGASAAGGAVPSRPQTTLERIRSETAKAMDQPLPPGSTTY